jgi:cytochrome c-type biogenesis protein CcmH/NrfG
MNPPDLQRIRAAVAQDPGNAELRYLLGAELAQQKEYDAAVVEMHTALQLNPSIAMFGGASSILLIPQATGLTEDLGAARVAEETAA